MSTTKNPKPMKKILMFVVMMMFVITSFSQVYCVKVDTVQHFEHSATITTSHAIKYDMIKYTESGTTGNIFSFNLDKNMVTCIFFSGEKVMLPIIKRNESTSILNVDVMTENNRIGSVIIDYGKKSEDGVVVIVRWNEMKNGIPTTCGWFSKNVSYTHKN